MATLPKPVSTVADIVTQLQVRGALLERARAEKLFAKEGGFPRDLRQIIEKDLGFFETQGWLDWFSGDELRLLRQPLGNWSELEVNQQYWAYEAYEILLWSVGISVKKLTPWHQEVNPLEWRDLCAIRAPDIEKEARRHRLRSSKDLERADDEAERRLWLARDEELRRRRNGDTPSPTDLFGKKPYHALTEEELQRAWSIAYERLRAIRWIWHGGPWFQVNMDT